MSEKFKITMRAHRLPDGTTVTKRTGEKEYVLRRVIKVYGEDRKPIEIKASEGTVFLVNPMTGDANVIQGTTEISWLTTADNLVSLLHGEQMERESK